MTSEPTQLALRAVRDAFARYQRRERIEGCPHCVDPEARPEDDLDLYARKAMNTWGDEEDFKHFLPELLQWMSPFADILVGKIHQAKWSEWPDDERVAVQRYYSAVWFEMLGAWPTKERAFDVLEWCASLKPDIDEELRPFHVRASVAARLHLARLICDIGFNWGESTRTLCWSPHSCEAVSRLLRSQDMLEWLEAGFFEGGEELARFSKAVDIVTWYRNPGTATRD